MINLTLRLLQCVSDNILITIHHIYKQMFAYSINQNDNNIKNMNKKTGTYLCIVDALSSYTHLLGETGQIPDLDWATQLLKPWQYHHQYKYEQTYNWSKLCHSHWGTTIKDIKCNIKQYSLLHKILTIPLDIQTVN